MIVLCIKIYGNVCYKFISYKFRLFDLWFVVFEFKIDYFLNMVYFWYIFSFFYLVSIYLRNVN